MSKFDNKMSYSGIPWGIFYEYLGKSEYNLRSIDISKHKMIYIQNWFFFPAHPTQATNTGPPKATQTFQNHLWLWKLVNGNYFLLFQKCSVIPLSVYTAHEN